MTRCIISRHRTERGPREAASRDAWLAGALVLLLCSLPRDGAAHGGVSIEDDLCVLQVGTYRMHFTGYQPEESGAQEFCEDIPKLGPAIIVLDAIDDALRDMPIELRLLADVKHIGNRAKVADLGTQADIDAATLVELPAARHSTGSLTVEHRFEQAGRYIGYVRAQPAVGGEIRAVFPFAVGATPTRYWVYGGVVAGALVVAAGLLYFALRLRGQVGSDSRGD
jgi:hypothetical protein